MRGAMKRFPRRRLGAGSGSAWEFQRLICEVLANDGNKIRVRVQAKPVRASAFKGSRPAADNEGDHWIRFKSHASADSLSGNLCERIKHDSYADGKGGQVNSGAPAKGIARRFGHGNKAFHCTFRRSERHLGFGRNRTDRIPTIEWLTHHGGEKTGGG